MKSLNNEPYLLNSSSQSEQISRFLFFFFFVIKYIRKLRLQRLDNFFDSFVCKFLTNLEPINETIKIIINILHIDL